MKTIVAAALASAVMFSAAYAATPTMKNVVINANTTACWKAASTEAQEFQCALQSGELMPVVIIPPWLIPDKLPPDFHYNPIDPPFRTATGYSMMGKSSSWLQWYLDCLKHHPYHPDACLRVQ